MTSPLISFNMIKIDDIHKDGLPFMKNRMNCIANPID